MPALASTGAASYPRDRTDGPRADLQRRAVELRLRAVSYRAIGADLGVSRTTAMQLVRAAAESPTGPASRQLRDRERAHVEGRLRDLGLRRRLLAAGGTA